MRSFQDILDTITKEKGFFCYASGFILKTDKVSISIDLKPTYGVIRNSKKMPRFRISRQYILNVEKWKKGEAVIDFLEFYPIVNEIESEEGIPFHINNTGSITFSPKKEASLRYYNESKEEALKSIEAIENKIAQTRLSL